MANKKKEAAEKSVSEIDIVDESQIVNEVETVREKYIPKEIDPTQMIVVRNGFQGRLVYISSRTHEKYIWDSFGGEQEIELRELRNAKNSAKKFFMNNWFMFDPEYEWVIDYLGLTQYYKNAIRIDSFDDVFKKKPEEVKKIIANLSNGQKNSLAYRARQMVADEEIDSHKMIAALESALNIELIER